MEVAKRKARPIKKSNKKVQAASGANRKYKDSMFTDLFYSDI